MQKLKSLKLKEKLEIFINLLKFLSLLIKKALTKAVHHGVNLHTQWLYTNETYFINQPS